jgi:hypothetical protein
MFNPGDAVQIIAGGYDGAEGIIINPVQKRTIDGNISTVQITDISNCRHKKEFRIKHIGTVDKTKVNVIGLYERKLRLIDSASTDPNQAFKFRRR